MKYSNAMSITETSHFTNKAGKIKVLSTYDGINFIDKNDPNNGWFVQGSNS